MLPLFPSQTGWTVSICPSYAEWPCWIFPENHFKNRLFLSAACRSFTRLAAKLRPLGVRQRRQGMRANLLHAAQRNTTIFSQIFWENPTGPFCIRGTYRNRPTCLGRKKGQHTWRKSARGFSSGQKDRLPSPQKGGGVRDSGKVLSPLIFLAKLTTFHSRGADKKTACFHSAAPAATTVL